MFQSIIKKEWLKLKFYILGMLILVLSSLVYFWFTLDFLFSTVEPESMMWYKFSHLNDKPYFYISYIFLFLSLVVSFAQFLPERIRNRIKIMAHLPLELRDTLFIHLLIGVGFLSILLSIYSIGLVWILSSYYPDEIIYVSLRDIIAYSFTAIVLYIGTSAVILEKNSKAIFFKIVLIVVFVAIFLKHQYTTIDILWILFLLFIPFVALDSFYSVKQQVLNSYIYKISLFLVSVVFIYLSYISYSTNYQKTFNKYYIFYSNIAKDFVYQKNFGDHRFEYGIKGKNRFDRTTYESMLPFVYWRNLDIQGKLPLHISNKSFDKKMIKNSRLGFSYNPKYLAKQEVQLFPLLNPNSNKGMIKFPEEVFSITDTQAIIYDFDNGLNQALSNELTSKLKKAGFFFPALNIWGKSTNMKPFDKGYLIKDSNQNLFNISRIDGKLIVKEVTYPKNIDIVYIKISENKQKILSGYVIDTKSNFYLLTWDFKFIKLNLEHFDYKTMKLKLISNPLNYLIRYDNADDYYSVVFDKSYNYIKSIKLD